jgi:hypothetical protein
MTVAGVRAGQRGAANPNLATNPRRGFVQQQLNPAALLSRSQMLSGGGERQKWPPRLVLFVTQIARRIAEARDQRALPWHADESASRGL